MSTGLDQSLGLAEAGQLNDRGSGIIENIRQLQTTEKGLFEQLQRGAAAMTLNSSQQQDMVTQIKNVSDARSALYGELQQNQAFYKNNVGVAHNILTQETDALEVVERELHHAEKRIGLIREQRANRLRLVEINRYYGDKYKHHTLILQYVTVVFALILVLTYLYNQGFVPPFLYTTLFVIIGTLGSYYIIKEIWDAYSRDSMMYQQYNWTGLRGVPDQDATPDGNKILGSQTEEQQASCVGQDCCQPSSTWVPQPINKCYPNTQLRNQVILAQFPQGIQPYDGTSELTSAFGSNELINTPTGQQLNAQLAKYN